MGQIISPPEYVGNIMNLLFDHEGSVLETEVLTDGRNLITIEMPLRELMRNFFDKLNSSGARGYAYGGTVGNTYSPERGGRCHLTNSILEIL